MNVRDDSLEKYYREMMEMYRRAVPVHTEQTAQAAAENKDVCDEETHEETHEEAEDICEESDEQKGCELPQSPEGACTEYTCPKWAEGIALCEFTVENAANGKPIENAQILLFRSDGFFVRTLTDESGRSGEIPVLAEGVWRVSITSQGYVSVSKALVKPVAGEKITIPVRLDESMSFDGIFAEHSNSIVGA